ncbi:uncharacterized protein H6S33_004836 [Morchella sextelata]|uniref:uncharacterized protein n=1 Tax=Morchella sextelata TaxID=1174677 RepID=UPI001D05541D|nr:uncharacterized protein H6S33_004836 [Morchella sextelata]KAH0605614.1 hypothetical protein H6S33_004836 [Morchella sextelata]
MSAAPAMSAAPIPPAVPITPPRAVAPSIATTMPITTTNKTISPGVAQAATHATAPVPGRNIRARGKKGPCGAV